MGNGIIFVVIVGLWAVVLVPQWLRKHDAAAESKSVERYSTAMRSLSRRGTGPRSAVKGAGKSSAGARDMLVPGGSHAPVLSGGRAPSSAARRAYVAKQARMRRRRTITFSLVGFLAVLGAAAALGTAPIWLPLVVLLATGGYVWNLRAQTLREARMERIRRRRSGAAPATRPVTRPATRPLPQAPIWPVTASARGAAPVKADTAVIAEQLDGAWAPTPIVLPTYATAPPATSIPRVIDLTHPGSWSAAHMLDHAAAEAAPDPDEIFDGRADLEAPEVFVDPNEISVEHAAVAQTVAGASGRSFLDDDAVFDQYDEDEQFLALLERRAVND